MLIESRPVTDPEIAALVVAQQRELRDADGGLDGQVTVVHTAIHYLAAVVGGRAVGCGGLQALDAGTGELKRMYVRPAYRGRGIARQLLVALEELAFRQGHRTVPGDGHLPAGRDRALPVQRLRADPGLRRVRGQPVQRLLRQAAAGRGLTLRRWSARAAR